MNAINRTRAYISREKKSCIKSLIFGKNKTDSLLLRKYTASAKCATKNKSKIIQDLLRLLPFRLISIYTCPQNAKQYEGFCFVNTNQYKHILRHCDQNILRLMLMKMFLFFIYRTTIKKDIKNILLLLLLPISIKKLCEESKSGTINQIKVEERKRVELFFSRSGTFNQFVCKIEKRKNRLFAGARSR